MFGIGEEHAGLGVGVEAVVDAGVAAAHRALDDDDGLGVVDIEDHLQFSRRYYNGTVRDYNTRIEQFPANLVAGLLAMKQRDYVMLQSVMVVYSVLAIFINLIV